MPRLVLAALALLLPLAAQAAPRRVLEAKPAAEAIIDGRTQEFSVRFDGPVDHLNSRLFITQNGRTVETLTVLRDSAPDVLFATAPVLKSGNYLLNWEAKAVPEGEASNGSLAFSVK